MTLYATSLTTYAPFLFENQNLTFDTALMPLTNLCHGALLSSSRSGADLTSGAAASLIGTKCSTLPENDRTLKLET